MQKPKAYGRWKRLITSLSANAGSFPIGCLVVLSKSSSLSSKQRGFYTKSLIFKAIGDQQLNGEEAKRDQQKLSPQRLEQVDRSTREMKYWVCAKPERYFRERRTRCLEEKWVSVERTGIKPWL
ncbi:hyaluronidase PH-20 [Platysternon megacephalum]|uniref:Hyaluronidase PH-20 n=1 Tax=Platysternon megacephalum TaxID=55544 RepID=A0A4D9DNC8_9SAUR|nr:hyaluronidase PH-20 [Platysternon megacephalum]